MSGSDGGLRVSIDKDSGVAVLTLDRPEKLNAIDLGMAAELASAWREFRFDDSVRALVITGAGERAFSTGIDRGADVPQPNSPYMVDDPLVAIGPKANDLWKPVIAAVNGMACGGAFYLLGESEFVVADETATFSIRTPRTAWSARTSPSTWRSGCRSGRWRGWR